MRSLICLRFFFSSRRRHTRSLCDWSSDVCSSDLLDPALLDQRRQMLDQGRRREQDLEAWFGKLIKEFGRASCRERVYISGAGVALNKKNVREAIRDARDRRI